MFGTSQRRVLMLTHHFHNASVCLFTNLSECSTVVRTSIKFVYVYVRSMNARIYILCKYVRIYIYTYYA